ncbi:MAG: hypothetical protein QOJ42_2457 [Acidobacteriaceae bacterium]|jgi:hypothetical protein|nr:hypothetical protein [Acidobacteriaceae bacterium]
MKRVIGSHSRIRIGAAVHTKRGTKIAKPALALRNPLSSPHDPGRSSPGLPAFSVGIEDHGVRRQHPLHDPVAKDERVRHRGRHMGADQREQSPSLGFAPR